MARHELRFQKHIIDSYKQAGGYAKKWASDLAVGNPDLVCALHPFGGHMMEVKHRPTWDGQRDIKNPMTAKQRIEMDRWMDSGVMGILGIVTGEKAIKARLYLCWPSVDYIDVGRVYAWADYQPGVGFPMRKLLIMYKGVYDEQFS